MHQFRPSRADQSGKAQNFTFMEFKADVPDSVAAESVHLQNHFFGRSVVLHGVVFRELAADHQLDESLLVCINDIQRFDIFSVAENGYPVTDFKQLVQPVGDIDDGDASAFQFPDHIEEPSLFFNGDGRGGFIQNKNPGVSQNCLADLHNLAVGHGQFPNPGLRRNVALKLFQQFLCLPVSLRLIDEKTAVASLTHEEIVCNGHGLELNHLLIHHRNSQFQRLLRREMIIGDTVKDDFPFVRLDRAGDGFDKRRLSRTVLSHQGVNLSFPETDGDIIQCDDAGIALGNVVQLQ